jgi:4-hydroxy-tetrahydrodipicolinate synthase
MHTEMSSVYGGLWIPLITPFKSDFSLDTAALIRLLDHYIGLDIAGLVINGTTGEPSALSSDEQLQVLDLALAHGNGKKVIAGVSSYSLAHTLEQLQALKQRAVAGVLISAPAYVRPSQAGLQLWFETLANASPAPVVLYDIPYRSGVTVHRDTLLTLANHPNIAALKDCGGDGAKTQALLAHGGIEVLAGEDLQIFSTLAMGGAGAIAASAHCHTAQFLAVMQALKVSDLPTARAAWQDLVPWIETAFAHPNPAPVKALLAAQGWVQNVLRPPMVACE